MLPGVSLFSWRGVFSLLLIFLSLNSSCQRGSNWKECSVSNRCSNHTLRSSLLKADGFTEQLAVCVRRHENKTFSYVEGLSIPFRTLSLEEPYVPLQLITEEDVVETLAYCHSGGQRLRLNEAATEFLLTHLKNGQECTLSVSGYQRVIPAF